MSQVIDSLDEARAAAERQAWRAAYAAFGEVDTAELSAADLESYGESAWWSGQIEEAIRHRERAFAAYTSSGDTLGAARMALTLGWDYEGRGAFAVAGGWIASAERLLAGLPKAPEHGRLLLTHALTAMFAEGNLERAVELFDEAYDLAAGVGDRDVQMLALSGKGRSFIKAGRIDEGLALLDEASASRDVRRPQRALRRARLLHHDQLLPGRRRLPARSRVDGGCEPVVRHARRHRIPRRMPDPPCRGDAPAGRLAGGGGAGARGNRGAQGLRPDDHGGRPLRDRRNPPASR